MDPNRDEPQALVVVDAANVIAARPNGWWKDRAGAAERLVHRIVGAARAGAAELRGGRVVVVLEGRAALAAEPADAAKDGVVVVRATGHGDDAIVDAVQAHAPARAGATDDVLVVTSDRELRRRVEDLGARVHGAGWLLTVLDRADGAHSPRSRGAAGP